MRSRHYGGMAFLLVLCLFFICSADSMASQLETPVFEQKEIDEAVQHISDQYMVTTEFTSHLPLLLIEYPDAGMDGVQDNGVRVIRISEYSSRADNQINDNPDNVVLAQASYPERNENTPREKEDYYLRLQGEDGSPAHLLGLNESSDYWLLGSMYDHSLLRNYLGITLAAQMKGQTPRLHFCEVILRQEQCDVYQGIYLLVEHDRPEDTLLLRRTTDNHGIILNTYGLQDHWLDGYWIVPAIETMDEAKIEAMTTTLSRIDAVIYADDLNDFSHYVDYIDVDSFTDFFIINELMGNYNAKSNAYYTYNEAEKRLYMGPVWDFERSLDNQIDERFDHRDIQFDDGGYFEYLLQSRSFIDSLRRRLLSLRAEVLSEENYYAIIDSAVEYLGAAPLRDWYRWEKFFAEHEELTLQPMSELITNDGERLMVDSFSRMPQTHAQEVIRIKYLLREHDLYASQRVSRLEVKLGANIRGAEASYVSNALMFLGFFVIFALIIHLGRRFAP